VASVLAALTMSLLVFAGPVLGTTADVVVVNPSTNSCDAEGIGLSGGEFDLKQKDIKAGVSTYDTVTWGGLVLNFDAAKPDTADIVSMSSPDFYVKAIVIQGSGNSGAATEAFLYSGAGVTSDTEIKVGGFGHFVQVIFCFGDAVPATPPSGGGSLPNGAIAQGGGVSPIPTVVFTGILLSSLAALAFANVKSSRSRI
jgi:hypothetical protein